MIEINNPKMQIRSSEAALSLAVDAYKSRISDLVLRTKQAEEMTAILLSEKLTSEQMYNMAIQLMGTHVRDKANERAIHYQQVIQATNLAISNLVNMLNVKSIDKLDLENIQGTVNTIAKGLVVALGVMSKVSTEKKQSDISTAENS